MTDNTTITSDFNLNQSDCIKSKNDFTQTTYYNICTGTTSVVPLGGMDMLETFGALPLLLAATILVVSISIWCVRLAREE